MTRPTVKIGGAVVSAKMGGGFSLGSPTYSYTPKACMSSTEDSKIVRWCDCEYKWLSLSIEPSNELPIHPGCNPSFVAKF